MAVVLLCLAAVPALGLLVVLTFVSAWVVRIVLAHVLFRGYDLPLAILGGVNEVFCRVWHRLPPLERQPLPDSGPTIVVAPHRTSIDPFLIAAQCKRNVQFMVAREYYETPALYPLLRLARTVPVTRDKPDLAAIRATLRELERGRVIGIFPEGGINTDGKKSAIHNGVAMLALKSGAVVVPAYISGIAASGDIGSGVLQRSHARVVFGAPVNLDDFRGRRAGAREQEAAAARIWAAVLALAPSAPREGSAAPAVSG